MRRRPKVQLFLRPGVAVPGRELVAEVSLDSAAETPTSEVLVTLRGTETVTVHDGNHARSERREHVARQARFGPKVLGKGRHWYTTRFAIPASAPPSYAGSAVSIEYELEVHVDIPWWPDRTVRYLVPVAPASKPASPARPGVYCNTSGGPRGKDLYVELALDDLRIESGGVVSGAVSFANVGSARVRRVELCFHAQEHVRLRPGEAEYHREGRVWSTRILDRAPTEGEAVSFRVRFPEDATPGFTSALARVEWKLAVVAVVSLGRDVRIEVPIEVVSAERGDERAGRRRRIGAVPPVGRERHALVLRGAAQRLELEVASTKDEIRGGFGAASFAIRLEHREGVGLFGVVDLSWVSLGIDLEVRERKWTDAFGGAGVVFGDTGFDDRFQVQASDAALAAVLLAAEVRGALAAFDEVEIDDCGARLSRRASVQSADALATDLRPALDAARALAEARDRVPGRDGAPYR